MILVLVGGLGGFAAGRWWEIGIVSPDFSPGLLSPDLLPGFALVLDV